MQRSIRNVSRLRTAVLAALLASSSQLIGQTPQTGNVFNPNISAIGNFLATAGHNEVDDAPSFQMKKWRSDSRPSSIPTRKPTSS